MKHWVAYATKGSGEYYGSKAKINLWSLPHDIKPSQQQSGYAMWVSNEHEITNAVIAGFQADGYNSTGCYNLMCKSFVMVDWNVLTPGSVVGPVSIYNGAQYYITISVKKDAKTRDWFLYREDLGEPRLIGYWPKSLFTTLADRADAVSWGGMVSYDTDDAGPPLGSGHHASELERKAAYFKNIEIFYSDGKSHDLIDGEQDRFADKEECYTISKLVDSSKYGRHDGHLFYFGGPGGCDG
ncbi:uncharacterized protein LOC109727908 [Ananas comosus]|uniref:Uncharacterized protein LOC109727908 n=1 Tax=Ananas comosus TaxID=4615 RepID=A0A6P5HGR4_ANACO|nr:uncharacterized protein LOC109727908 [Ananas comosus]